MHFENYEPVKYKHNILFHVAFQARFPEIMRIQHEPPIAFQDALRKEGYTEITRGFPAVPPGIIPNQASNDIGKIFHFLPEQRDWEVVLSQDFIALNCHRNYRNYSGFKEELEKVLRIFYEIYSPPYFTRIDLLSRNMANGVFLPHLKQVSVESFIPEYIFPVLRTPKANDVLSLQTVSQFDDNEIKAHVAHTLSQVSGEFGQKQVTDEKSYIIEIDCFYDRNVGVIDEIFTKCDIFKKLERNFFEWSITEALREAMGKSGS